MKKLLLLSTLLFSLMTFAQIPQGISYQAIALNSSGNPVVSSNIGVRLSVLDVSATGTALYTETQTKMTSAQGLFNLVIGQGAPVSGTFAGINWKTNSKFLKVEMDVAGGSNYVLVGTTQLLSVPYALAAKSLVLAPGEGITLTSPNGTQYQLSVSNDGTLSLPTATSSGAGPSELYLYGTFNSFNPSTALMLYHENYNFIGFKYLTSGSQVKILSGNTAGAAVYGLNSGDGLVLNGSAFTVPSSGLYFFNIGTYGNGEMYMNVSQFAPQVTVVSSAGQDAEYYNMTYNVATNTLSTTITGVLNSDKFFFMMPDPNASYVVYGDFLGDGITEEGGNNISFPGASASIPKNYKIDFVMSINGTGNYTVTLVP